MKKFLLTFVLTLAVLLTLLYFVAKEVLGVSGLEEMLGGAFTPAAVTALWEGK